MFVAASVALLIVPGPAVLYIVGRSLTLGRGLNPADFETWIRNLYDKMLLH